MTRLEGWMSEDEWLTSNDAMMMLHVIRLSSPSDRKVRLFNAAMCRRFWDYLPEASQSILLESELLADGLLPLGSDDFELCRRANLVVFHIWLRIREPRRFCAWVKRGVSVKIDS